MIQGRVDRKEGGRDGESDNGEGEKSWQGPGVGRGGEGGEGGHNKE